MGGMVVLNQLGPEIGAALAGHEVKPSVFITPPDLPPWEVGEADVLLTGPQPHWRDAPGRKPPGWPGKLRWVQVASAGVDWFPPWLFEGPTVTCGRGHAAVPIAEYVLGTLLLYEKRLDQIRAQASVEWVRHTLGTLEGRTLGLAGFGAIGQAVAQRAAAFGMRIVALRAGAWGEAEAPGIERARDLAELFSVADHLVLALPLTPATRRCVNAEVLAQAKRGLHLINIARGCLVDQEALIAALDAGRLGFATLDVTEPEPLPSGHSLYLHPRIRLTPHVSWSGNATRLRLTEQILTNLTAFARGESLQGVVDLSRGY
jgi:phosphoglycerate dehydrogenase-like enzyme